jgi:hypothetical protein
MEKDERESKSDVAAFVAKINGLVLQMRNHPDVFGEVSADELETAVGDWERRRRKLRAGGGNPCASVKG